MKCPLISPDSIVRGDARELLKCLPDGSVDLFMMSPPYAGKRTKSYDTVGPDEYVEWFSPFAREMQRTLKPSGSFVLNIKESVFNGQRHPYVFDLVKNLQQDGWRWTETYIWKKDNSYPIKPIKRLKDQFEYLFHFTKGDNFQFFPENVMVDAKDDTCRRYQRAVNTMAKRGSTTFIEKDRHDYYRYDAKKLVGQCRDGALKVFPGNVITASIGTNRAFKGVHYPAMFPRRLPEFFVDLLTKPGDLVVDPFAGSGTTSVVAKEKCRRTIGFDIKKEFADTAGKRLSIATCKD